MLTTLTLHEIQLFDATAQSLAIGHSCGEQRALCPLCGADKPRDAAHRSLSLNRATGAWHCHRCGQGGKVKEAWQDRAPLSRSLRSRHELARAFDVAVPQLAVGHAAPVETKESGDASPVVRQVASWKRELHDLRGLDENRSGAGAGSDGRGEDYLRGRGLDVAVARAAGTRFCPAFMGRAALVFPLRDLDGQLRGVHARYVDGCDRPKARTLGDKSQSVFASASAFDAVLPALIVTEAPLDALSLAHAGYPAIAVCGTSAPQWIHRAVAFRRVLLAFDADDAGDRAAEMLAPVLTSYGARCERLRPEGAKDWNEALSAGRDELSDWLAARIL